MSVDTEAVKRVAALARIKLQGDQAQIMTGELNTILGFVEQLNEVDVDGVEPMTSVVAINMKMRDDLVETGGHAAEIVSNAPATEDHFFMVPKVIE
jgi:aspartyl-tRNA(Asn)/glutamyl-tRNA(Gln) amidotransferase subunit C